MPKISVHSGASNKYETAAPAPAKVVVVEVAPELVEDDEPDLVAVVLAAIEEPAPEAVPELLPVDADAIVAAVAAAFDVPVALASPAPPSPVAPSPSAFVRPRKAAKPDDGG